MIMMVVAELLVLLLCADSLVLGKFIDCPSYNGIFGPTIDESTIITSISVDSRENGSTICRMQYAAPEGATLWQAMLAAHQQLGQNFTFQFQFFVAYGHFITTINGLAGNSDYFWALRDGNGQMTPVGVDLIYPMNQSSYIWTFDRINHDHHNSTYDGPCRNATSVQASLPLTYVIAYLSVSSENTVNFVNETSFMPVCKQLVLFNSSQATLYHVLMTAGNQVPFNISSVIVDDEIKSLNSLRSQDGYTWIPFNATTDMMIPYELSLTNLKDGDHIVFRFKETEVVSFKEATSMSTATTMTSMMITDNSAERKGGTMIIAVAITLIAVCTRN